MEELTISGVRGDASVEGSFFDFGEILGQTKLSFKNSTNLNFKFKNNPNIFNARVHLSLIC